MAQPSPKRGRTQRRGFDPRSTTERGLGWAHQKRRKRALAQLVPDTPCPFCGEPMHREQALDLDHTVPRSLGGSVGDRLAHSSCNRRAGNGTRTVTSSATPPRPRPTRTSRDW